MSLTEKLDRLMLERGLSRRQFALQAGIPYMTIVNFYEKGTEGVKLSTLRKITSFFGVSFDYLADDRITDPHHGKTDGFALAYAEMQAVKKYRALSPHGKDLVDTVLQKQYAHENLYPAGTSADHAKALIDLRHYWDAPSAGTGNSFADGGYDVIQVEDSPVSRSADFALTVSGHSMEPKYLDGDIVLVRAQETYEVGDIVVFARDGESYIKLAGRGCFESINPDYPDIRIHDEDSFRCFGIVVGKV